MPGRTTDGGRRDGMPVGQYGAVTVRIAYTLEQLWHRVPGGTAMAALRVAEALRALDGGAAVEVRGVAGRHTSMPVPPWVSPVPVHQLPLRAPFLYDAWIHLRRPRVEVATGPVDIAHATTLIPCASAAPLVVTVHDMAWRHAPEQFTRRGVSVFERSIAASKRRAARVLCSSTSTMEDCAAAGFDPDLLRLVPLGVDMVPVTDDDVVRVRAAHRLPSEYLLFVGTLEPRKNLGRLAAAVADVSGAPPLVVAGADGWGDASASVTGDVRFLGFVPEADKAALYAGALAFCYPSEREGFGMPVLEAMAQATPVLTSRGTSTEEVSGGAAVLVDPFDVDAIAAGIGEVLARRAELASAGRARAAACTWEDTARRTLAVYEELL